jgi:hypothetical protein
MRRRRVPPNKALQSDRFARKIVRFLKTPL